MKSQLYVTEMTRRYLKSKISDYIEIYFKKLLPVFKDIESDADKYANDFYDNFISQPASDDFIDPSSIAEEALDIGIEHYSYLKLGKYRLTANGMQLSIRYGNSNQDYFYFAKCLTSIKFSLNRSVQTCQR
jgi:alpha-L-arabinofuranosidase